MKYGNNPTESSYLSEFAIISKKSNIASQANNKRSGLDFNLIMNRDFQDNEKQKYFLFRVNLTRCFLKFLFKLCIIHTLPFIDQ